MTEKYHKNDPMSDVISDDYRMLQLLSRFGITLGFGDQSVADTCRSAGVDVGTFLAVVNYVKDPTHARVNELADEVRLPALMQYLKNSHQYFVDYRLPYIRRQLIEAIDVSAGNRIAFLILRFYDEFANEVARHMEFENSRVHPYVEMLLQGRLPQETFVSLVDRHEDNHASIEKSISELKSIVIKYYPNTNNAQLLNDVLMDVYMTEEDLQTHCRLEDTLFAECVQRLEEKVRCQASEAASGMADDATASGPDTAEGAELSDREKEIIVQVVRGLSNKAIADELFISVNTVMTHRRNISRKLQIHSIAGLTIYAIVNGLVNLDDVKF